MASVKEILAGKPYPIWIKKTIKSVKTLEKVFPSIGLVNSEKVVEVNNKPVAKNAADAICSAIKTSISERLQEIEAIKIPSGGSLSKQTEYVVHLLGLILKTKFSITDNNGKLGIHLSSNVVDVQKNILFKKGEGLFRVYNKLNEILLSNGFLEMDKLEGISAFKDFSSKNVPSVSYKIVFSSDGVEGIWDIATMSMRGISSCQSWGNYEATGLIGSIVDPFTGIIYLTSGEDYEGYGSKMIRRCVVRLMFGDRDGKASLLIERMYPSNDCLIRDKFVSFLREKTGNKFPVSSSGYDQSIPQSSALANLGEYCLPYLDSTLGYADPIDMGMLPLNSDAFLKHIAPSFMESMRKNTSSLNKKQLSQLYSALYIGTEDILWNALKENNGYGFLETMHKDPNAFVAKLLASLKGERSLIPKAKIPEISKMLSKQIAKYAQDRVKALEPKKLFIQFLGE